MMSRRSEQSIEAEKLYREGNKLVDIAKKLGVPEGTVRRWKSTQDWEGKKKPSERSGKKANAKKANASTSGKANARKRPQKNLPIEYSENGEPLPSSAVAAPANPKTNTPHPQARPGNKNAVGNKGGKGGPRRNKNAVRTHEYESFYYGDLDEDERRFIEQEDLFLDKYFQQLNLLRDLTLREREIQKDIRELRNSPSGMAAERVIKGKTTTHAAQPVLIRINELREVLTRVQTRKQTAINQLHRMQMEEPDNSGVEDIASTIRIILETVRNPAPNRTLPEDGDET